MAGSRLTLREDKAKELNGIFFEKKYYVKGRYGGRKRTSTFLPLVPSLTFFLKMDNPQ